MLSIAAIKHHVISRQRIKPSISFDLQLQRVKIYDGRMKEQLRVHVLIYIVTRKRGGGLGMTYVF